MASHDVSSSSESASSEAESETELMITTRERRATAGNRYSKVVAQEQEDEDAEDEVNLLFADDDGEDEEYNSDEADDEADMSSSDDDDQGPNVAPDDLGGENELQKQAKLERQKKRKADLALTTQQGIRKKAKLDPTALHRAPDRAKSSKRKERVSWLPDQALAPGRVSQRTQTVAHREALHEKLKEKEEARLKFNVIREEKEKQKQADTPKEMTQADRLAEAGRVERRNAKSLNRWEATERRRAEDQAARLAALKDRKLNGAVVTFYSTRHAFKGLKVETGTPGPSEDGFPKKRGRKPKVRLEQVDWNNPAHSAATNSLLSHNKPMIANSPLSRSIQPVLTTDHNAGLLPGMQDFALLPPNLHTTNASPTSHVAATTEDIPAVPSRLPIKTQSASDTTTDNTTNPQVTPVLSKESSNIESTNNSVEAIAEPPRTKIETAPAMPLLSSIEPSEESQTLQVSTPNLNDHYSVSAIHSSTPDQVATLRAQSPPIEVISTRNLVVLSKIDELEDEARRAFSILLNTKKSSSKPVKRHGEVCGFTGLPARYRDPVTETPYANLLGYKKLRDLQSHQFRWSSMLGCYTGRVGQAARDVPEGFLT